MVGIGTDFHERVFDPAQWRPVARAFTPQENYLSSLSGYRIARSGLSRAAPLASAP
jgi:hypothetical protein